MMKQSTIALAAAVLLLTALPATARAAEPQLTVAAESRSMIWSGVAVDGDRVFVSGPRWSGSKGPAVGMIDGKGQPAGATHEIQSRFGAEITG